MNKTKASRPMPRIAVIGLKGLPARGGAATVGEAIINELASKYRFTVLSVRSHTSALSGPINGTRQLVFPSLGNGAVNTFVYYVRCLLHVLTHSYDLIFLHHAESGFITPLLRLRYKVVVTFHGVFSYKDPKFSGLHNLFFRFSEKLNVKYANVAISVAYEDVNFIKNKYGRRIHYIPNGVKVPEYERGGTSEVDPYIFFAAGRIYQIKGLHLLLNALHTLKIRMRLVVAGKMESLPRYTEDIRNLSEGLPVDFLGLVTEKSALLKLAAQAELFVFPSLTEAMSIMLLEAASTGVPVIASDIKANKAVFSDDEVLYFRSGDAHDLAEKLRFALENRDLMRRIGNNARQQVMKTYTSQRVGEQYDNIFKSLLH